MTVKSILSLKGRGVVTIEPRASLATAAKVLAERRIGTLVVMDSADHIAGLLSEREMVRALAAWGSCARWGPRSSDDTPGRHLYRSNDHHRDHEADDGRTVPLPSGRRTWSTGWHRVDRDVGNAGSPLFNMSPSHCAITF
jgi:CBS domain-containing protein